MIVSALHIRRGMSLAEAQQACRELGGFVEEGHHGGELRFSHPLARRHHVAHSQRQDAPIALVAWLQRIVRTLDDFRECVDALSGVAVGGRRA